MADPCADLDLETPVDLSAAIDARDVALVQKTWIRACGLGAETVGKVLFAQIFTIAPEAVGLFPFADYPQERLFKVGSPLVEYAAKVVNTFNVAIRMLDDLASLVPVLKTALPGLFPGAQKEHYGVVGQAALNSLEIALGRYWQEPVKNAWLKIWTTIVTVMFPPEELAPAPAAEAEAKPAEAAEEDKKKGDDEAEKKKKALEEKKKAEAAKKKELAAKKKKEEAEKKKKEEEAAKKAAAEAAKNAGKEKKKERVALFKEMEKADQDKLVKQLIDAAKSGNSATVKQSLEDNCDPDQADGDGQTALHYAADKGKTDCVKILLEYGADTSAKVKLGEWGLCPLHYAARQGHKDIAELVYDVKAMKNDNFLKKNPIEIAQEKGHSSVVSVIKNLQKAKK